MLLTMKELLDEANKNNYAVAAPNVTNEFDARAVIAAAEEMKAPIILDVGPLQSPDFVLTGKYMCELANETDIPVALHLDHGGSVTGAKGNERVLHDMMRAIMGGFTSVMVDRSCLPFEENVRQVAEMTHIAHSVGVTVESELGHVDDACKDRDERTSGLTDPAFAAEFVSRTGIDCLAVSIGNAHGTYTQLPVMDFARLAEIKEATSIPLVMHGGSGSGDENLYRVCRSGINKVNIYHDLCTAACMAVKNADISGNGSSAFWTMVQDAIRKRTCELIKLFGSDGKAWTPSKTAVPQKEKLFSSITKIGSL